MICRARGIVWLLVVACVGAPWVSAALSDELADALARAEELRVAIEAAKAEAEDAYATERRRLHAEHAESMNEAEATLRLEHDANGDTRGEFESEDAYTERMQAYREGLEAFTEAWGARRTGIDQARDEALTKAREAWEHPATVARLGAELQTVEDGPYRVEATTDIAPYRAEDQAFPVRLSHETWPVPPDAVAPVPVAEAEGARPGFGAVTVEYGIEDGKEVLRGMWVGEGDQYPVHAAEWTRVHRLEGYIGPTTGGVFLGHGRAVTAGADGRLVLWNTEVGTPVRDIDAHPGQITFLARSRQHIVSATERDLRLWDGRTLAPFMTIGNLQLLPPPEPGAPARRENWRQVSAVAINGPSGRLAYAVRSPVPRIELWDVPGEVREQGIEGMQALVTSLAFSPSGEVLAAGMSDGSVLSWRLRELTPYARDLRGPKGRPQIKARRARVDWVEHAPTEAFTIPAHKKPVTALAFTEDGSQLVTASEDKTAKLWDVESGEELRAFAKGHSGVIASVAVRDKGRRLVTGSRDGSARMWSLDTGKTIRRYRGHEGPVHSVAAVPGRGLLTTSEDGSARLWHMGTGWQQRALEGHKYPAWLVRVSDDGRRLLTADAVGSPKLWDLDTGAEIPGGWSSQSGSGSFAMTSDGRLIARADAAAAVRLWDTGSPAAVRSAPVGGALRMLRFSADDRWLFVAAEGRPLERWNVEALDDRRPLLPEPDVVDYASSGRNYSVSGDGGTICVRRADGAIQTWDISTAQLKVELSAGTLPTVGLALNHDGSRLLTRQVEEPGKDGPWTRRLWDTRSGKMLVAFPAPTQGRLVARFSPDGAVAVTYPRRDRDHPAREVTLWSAETGLPLRTLDAPPGGAHSVTFSADAARVAVAGAEDVRLHDSATGREVARLNTGFPLRTSVTWSADGTTIVSSSRKGVLDVWRPVRIGNAVAGNVE